MFWQPRYQIECNRLPHDICVFKNRTALSMKNSRGKVGLMAVSNRLPRDICVFFNHLALSVETHAERLAWWQWAIVFPVIFVFSKKLRGTVHENSRGKVGLMAVSNCLPHDICVFSKIARHCPWKTHVERLAWWQWAIVFPVIFVFYLNHLALSVETHAERLAWWQWAIVFPVIFVFSKKSRGTVHENSRGKVGLMAVSSRDDSPGAEEGTSTEWFGVVLEHQSHLRHHSGLVHIFYHKRMWDWGGWFFCGGIDLHCPVTLSYLLTVRTLSYHSPTRLPGKL